MSINVRLQIILLLIISLLSVSAAADDQKWSSSMNIGGFTVSDINGSISSDGSGSATGNLHIYGIGNQSIKLTRSSSGNVTGSGTFSGGIVSGSFSLSDNGLRANGEIKTSPRPLRNASYSISPQGEIIGQGVIRVINSDINTNFRLRGSSGDISGSRNVKSLSDTALASYELVGVLSLKYSSEKITSELNGQVKRTGKLAEETTTYNISNITVEIDKDKTDISVGGVNVTFNLK
ncbi:MAG: hypothetical protein SNJ70_01580 [Armatimonadota bacterium]